MQWILTPEVLLWIFETPYGFQLPKWECVGSFLHTPESANLTPRLHFQLTPFHVFALVTSLRLRAQQCPIYLLLPHDYNPITRLWERLGFSVIVNHHIFEWFKLAKLCMVMVMGNVKNKCTFSNLTFIKTKFWNHFTTHLNLVFKCMCRNSMT